METVERNTKNTFITKYKPYFIRDFFLDEHLLSVLQTLIEINQLNVLFVGGSSSGKTIMLHALIREYYGLGRDDPFPENNILFVNNLKEQGIQYFRNEMKTFCQTHSSIYKKKKLVIIDDLDNINEQSQQVFRNYIDKYKHNIHFISVCTNVQKVIESIQSRLHILRITPPLPPQIKEIVNNIIRREGIQIDEASVEYLTMISGSSIRILINFLEKIYILGEPVNLELCKKICSSISFQEFDEYIRCIQNDDLQGAINVLYNIYDYGYSVIDILDYFFAFIKITNLLDEEIKYRIIPYLCKYITIFHNVHEDSIELALLTNNLRKVVLGKN
jgi:DNA polymerase III delta prime subunit